MIEPKQSLDSVVNFHSYVPFRHVFIKCLIRPIRSHIGGQVLQDRFKFPVSIYVYRE